MEANKKGNQRKDKKRDQMRGELKDLESEMSGQMWGGWRHGVRERMEWRIEAASSPLARRSSQQKIALNGGKKTHLLQSGIGLGESRLHLGVVGESKR